MLERLLLDADVTAEAVGYLEAVGFRVTLAVACPVNIRNDTEILKYARKHRFILVGHDKHESDSTPRSWYPELAERGGKVIELSGGHLADPFHVVGKILNYRSQWLSFFATTHGAIVLHDAGVTPKPPHKLLSYVNRPMPLGVTPANLLKNVAKARPRKKRRKRAPVDQLGLPPSGAS